MIKFACLMRVMDYFFLALLSLSGMYYVLGTILLIRYHRRRRAELDGQTPVTILKPLAGNIPGLKRCLETFMVQTQHKVQIVFGVGKADDTARPVAEELMREYPQIDATLVVAGPLIGPNRKVTSLHYMLAHAKHELLMISDDDVMASPDLVARMSAEIREPTVGIVTATYWAPATSISLAFVSLTMATEFFPSVVIAEALEGGLSFALGPATILRRKLLDDIGGLEALAHYLAEDYLMGSWGRGKGWQIRLSRETVGRAKSYRSFGDMMLHQLRWARTYRVCRPGGYFLSILTQGIFAAAIYVAAAQASPLSLGCAGILVALRMACAGVQIALRGPKALFVWLWFVPLRDLLSVGLWAASFLGNKVRWREHVYRISSQGRLEALN